MTVVLQRGSANISAQIAPNQDGLDGAASRRGLCEDRLSRATTLDGMSRAAKVESNKTRCLTFSCTELFVLSYLFKLEGSLIDYGVNFKAT